MYVLLGLVALVTYLIYKIFFNNENYWQKLNVPYKKGVPFIGDKKILGLASVRDETLADYINFKDEPYYGNFLYAKPTLVVNDIRLIRDITVKYFDHFMDHSDFFIKTELDPILASSVLFQKGKPWKDLRSILSPVFTGSKMKIMFNLVVEATQNLIDYQERRLKSGEIVVEEMKDLFSRVMGDSLGSAAYGIKTDSVSNPNNEFITMARKISYFSVFRTFATLVFTKICRFFDYGLIPKQYIKYFRDFVFDTLRVRDEQKIYRPDVLQLMLQIRKGEFREEDDYEDDGKEFSAAKDTRIYLKKVASQRVLTDDEILAQLLLFIFGGFDTTSSALTFCIYELSINPDVQVRLQKEIDQVLKDCNGKITYEIIRDMKYLDMVISEGLRKYSPGVLLERLCTKDFELKTEKSSVTVKKGMTVTVPVVGIHHDPKYHPDPYKFNPERFNEANRKNIKDFTYMPFGMGPRNCIGNRFALMQLKITFFLIFSKFDICVCSKTQIPVKFKKTPILLLPEKGLWVEWKLRK